MTERVEKAYYLKEEELAVLLAITGVRQLYGFQMEDSVDIGGEKLRRTLFEMAKKGILSSEEGKLRIHAEIEAVLKELAGADNVLLLSGGEEYPENCIYIARNTVFVQLLGQSGRRYRLELVTREKTAERIQEYGWKVPGLIENTRIYPEDEALCQKLRERARILYDMDRESLLQQGKEVRSVLIQYSVDRHRKLQQLLLIRGELEDYIVVSSEQQDVIWLYSDAKSKELLGQMIGGLQ